VKWTSALAAIIIGLAFFAIPSIQSHNPQVVTRSVSPKEFSPQVGVNVTVLGVIKAANLAPACSLSNPPCTIPETAVYYVVVNTRNYRLIFSNTSEPPDVLGFHVIITGLYITPSTFQAYQWTPSLFFYGDIYVQKIVYFLRLPD
jgi:hypothetical protein